MKPAIGIFLLGIVLISVGVTVPVMLVLQIAHEGSPGDQFKAPGTVQITTTKTGRYYLWNDYQTLYQGKVYDRPENVPDGLEVHIRDESGNEIRFISDTSSSWSNGSYKRRSIGYVDLDRPGKLAIAVSGMSEERILSFSQSGFLKLFFTIAGIGLSFIFGVIGGFAVMLFGIVKGVRQRRGANAY